MMKIWKWSIEITDRQTLMMPAGAKILDVQVQDTDVALWALCNPDMPNVPRDIAIYGTGNHVPDSPGQYLATVQTHNNKLVWHVFDLSTY